MAGPSVVVADQPSFAEKSGLIIDFHIHIHPYPTEDNGVSMPRAYADRNAGRMARMGIPVDRQAEVAVKRMNETGVAAAVVQNPFHSPESGHVRTNQSVYDAIKDYPDRLYAFAGIYIRPKPDLAELEFAITELGFKGLKYIPASQNFRPNDFDLLDPLYKKLIELDVPVLSHPRPTFLPGSNAWMCDMRDYLDVVKRYPELNLVIAHAGSGAVLGEEGALAVANAGPNAYVEASGAMWSLTLDHIPPRSSKRPSAWEAFTHEVIWPETESGERTPEMEGAWQRGKEDHAKLLRHIVNRARGKLIYASDLPFIARFDFHELYTEALVDPDLLDDVLGGTARRLLKI